jgi:hypothetical protein
LVYPCCLNSSVPEIGTDQQTSFIQQTGDTEGETEEERLWQRVRDGFKQQMAANTYYLFVHDTHLLPLENTTATVMVRNPFAIDWLQQRANTLLRKALNMELRLLEGATARKVETVHCVLQTEP